MRTNFVVFSPFNYMTRFVETYDKAKGEKPEGISLSQQGLDQNFLELDVPGGGGQVMANKYAPGVADEIFKELQKRPDMDVIIDGNRLHPVVRFLAQNPSRITDEMRQRFYIVVESVHSGPVITHDLDFAEEFAYA